MQAMPWAWLLSWRAALGRNFLLRQDLHGSIAGSLVDAHRERDRQLLTFSLLGEEVHVLSCLPQEEDASAVARVIGAALGRLVRRVHPVASPVLAAPCRIALIEGISALRAEIRHLHRRADPLTGLESVPCGYSATAMLLGGISPAGFDPAHLLAFFGDDRPASMAAMEAFLAQPAHPHDTQTWELMRGLNTCLDAGERRGARLDRRDAAELMAAAGAGGVDGALQLIERWITERLDLPREYAIADLRGAAGSRARALVVAVAVTSGICSAARVARYYGRAKATLCSQLASLRRNPVDAWLARTPASTILQAAMRAGPDAKQRGSARPLPLDDGVLPFDIPRRSALLSTDGR